MSETLQTKTETHRILITRVVHGRLIWGAIDESSGLSDTSCGLRLGKHTTRKVVCAWPARRATVGRSLFPAHRVTSDGTYNYTYDDEGNRTRRTSISTGEVTEYE